MSWESLQASKLWSMTYWFEDKPVCIVFLRISWDKQDQQYIWPCRGIPQVAIWIRKILQGNKPFDTATVVAQNYGIPFWTHKRQVILRIWNDPFLWVHHLQPLHISPTNTSYFILEAHKWLSGWWYTYPSEKYDFASWDYYCQLNGKS